MTEPKTEISTLSIVKFLAIVLGLWVAYYIRDILVLLFVVLLLATALEPMVGRLTRWGIPRVFSILLVYLLITAMVVLAIYLVVPPLASQLRDLANNLPDHIKRISGVRVGDALTTQRILDSITQSLSKLSGGVFNAIVAIFGSILSALTVLTLTFYLLVEERGMRKALMAAVPSQRREKIAELSHKIGVKLGMWLRGQLTLMVIVAAATAIGLAILRVPYPLALALLAGILELMPVVGPIAAGLVAVTVAFISGAEMWQLIGIVILYILVQQLENQVLVPKIMKRAIGVSPVVIITAILIGGKLLGLGGAALAIPVVAILAVVSNEYFTNRRSA